MRRDTGFNILDESRMTEKLEIYQILIKRGIRKRERSTLISNRAKKTRRGSAPVSKYSGEQEEQGTEKERNPAP
jgi:hypothetical protein